MFVTFIISMLLTLLIMFIEVTFAVAGRATRLASASLSPSPYSPAWSA